MESVEDDAEQRLEPCNRVALQVYGFLGIKILDAIASESRMKKSTSSTETCLEGQNFDARTVILLPLKERWSPQASQGFQLIEHFNV